MVGPFVRSTIGGSIRSLRWSTIGWSIRSLQCSTIGRSVRPLQRSKIGGSIRPLQRSTVGRSVRPFQRSTIGPPVCPSQNSRRMRCTKVRKRRKPRETKSTHPSRSCPYCCGVPGRYYSVRLRRCERPPVQSMHSYGGKKNILGDLPATTEFVTRAGDQGRPSTR